MGKNITKPTSVPRYKILFLVSAYPTKNHPVKGIFIKRHAEAIAKFCDVIVLYITEDSHLRNKTYELNYSVENGIPTVRVYHRNIKKLPIIYGLQKDLIYIIAARIGFKTIKKRFGKPDIVHANIIEPAGKIAIILKFLHKIPFLITEHSSSFLPACGKYKRTQTLQKFFTKLVVKNAEAVITVSSALKNAMLSLGLKNQYFVVPNVVEVNTTSTIHRLKTRKKKILHISLILERSKNITGILKSLYNVIHNRKRDDFELHIIGEGKDTEKIKNLSIQLNLYNRYVFFEGMKHPEDVYQYLQEADFLITNSNYETFSVVTAEALACGIPVIATKCGGPEDFVTEETGILIEPGNEKQLGDAIIYMLDNSDKYEKRKLMEYANKRFNSFTVGRQFYEIYEKILFNLKRVEH
ncbi:MAG TPA: glycosyltransferase [Candidatus Ratteibacteria bacterium]|nr:glycosyltransferase [Candidatus Ratteibacteria bacterium]HRV03739.1 glycosyltransferase [Candidatus Ratteibacteria bacterium]